MNEPGTPTFDQLRIFLTIVDTGSFAAAGSLRARIAHAVDALVGPNRQAQAALPARFVPVRDFLCATGRTGRIAPAHAATLAAQGYSSAQIDALALLGA